MAITVQNARELAAMSHEARRRNKELREQAEQLAQEAQQRPAIGLEARSQGLDQLLSSLKAKLALAIERGESQDALRYAQAIDRLEQSWARYAGIPTPPKARTSRRQSSPDVEPL